MSGQVAFFPTNGTRPYILCDQLLGKGGGELPRVGFLRATDVSNNMGEGEGE